MAKVVFNEDSNHFLFTRRTGGMQRLTKQDIVDFVLQYKDTGIKDFMIDIGAPMQWYASRRHRGVMELYPEFRARGGKEIPYIDMLIEFHEREGTDVQTVLFETARKAGLRPFISLRMSDVHEGFCEDSFLWSDFYRAHKKTMNIVPHRKEAGYYDYCLNYHFSEVREHFLSILEEALERFDADGVELDWLREIYALGYGKEQEGIAVINGFMRRVYALVKEAEKRWGHAMEISVRMPDTPEKALRLGFDFFDWIEAGLIDRIAVSSRWATTDTSIPVDLWARILKGKKVKLAAGLEILMRGHDLQAIKPHSYETAVGTAAAFLSQGADEIYLFNFFDHYNGVSNIIYFGKDAALYRRFLSIAGDYETLVGEPRRHVLSYDDVFAVGVPSSGMLPLSLVCDRNAATPFTENILYKRMRIVTGKIPAGKTVKVILGFRKDTDYALEDITLYLNQKPCTYLTVKAPVSPQNDNADYLVFEAENDGTLPTASVIELGLAHGNTVLDWVEIAVGSKECE